MLLACGGPRRKEGGKKKKEKRKRKKNEEADGIKNRARLASLDLPVTRQTEHRDKGLTFTS